MVHTANFATEFKFSAFNSFPAESEARDLDEFDRFSYHRADGSLLFRGQVVEEARGEPFENDHVTGFWLLVFDTHIIPAVFAKYLLPHVLEEPAAAKPCEAVGRAFRAKRRAAPPKQPRPYQAVTVMPPAPFWPARNHDRIRSFRSPAGASSAPPGDPPPTPRPSSP